MDPTAGMLVTPNVRLLRPLGEGGMGSVWIAKHSSLGRELAVKFISAELLDNDALVARFEAEAKTAAGIKSQHVVQTFDHGFTDDGTPFIVMELLEGNDLADWLELQGTMSLADTATIVSQVCSVLSKTHALGVVHRDIKPDNLFLVDSEESLFVKVLDFGVAKQTMLPRRKGMTGVGVMVGTPEYMSPEQALAAHEVDARADLWALAVVAYEMLVGALPFDAESLGALIIQITKGHFVPPTALADLPAELDAFFERALAVEIAERFATADELNAAFRAVAEGTPRAEAASDADEPPRQSSGQRVLGTAPTLVGGTTAPAASAAPAVPAAPSPEPATTAATVRGVSAPAEPIAKAPPPPAREVAKPPTRPRRAPSPQRSAPRDRPRAPRGPRRADAPPLRSSELRKQPAPQPSQPRASQPRALHSPPSAPRSSPRGPRPIRTMPVQRRSAPVPNTQLSDSIAPAALVIAVVLLAPMLGPDELSSLETSIGMGMSLPLAVAALVALGLAVYVYSRGRELAAITLQVAAAGLVVLAGCTALIALSVTSPDLAVAEHAPLAAAFAPLGAACVPLGVGAYGLQRGVMLLRGSTADRITAGVILALAVLAMASALRLGSRGLSAFEAGANATRYDGREHATAARAVPAIGMEALGLTHGAPAHVIDGACGHPPRAQLSGNDAPQVDVCFGPGAVHR